MRTSSFLRIAVAALCVAAPHSLPAQSLTGAAKWADSARTEIEAATFSGDGARLAAARTLLSRALVAFPNDAMLMHYMGYALYRSLTMPGHPTALAAVAAIADSSRALLEKSASVRPMAESYALLSAVIGRQIAADPSLGATLGMEIQRVGARARELGAQNPRVYLIAGQGAMFTPPEWGGGVDQARTLLAKAVDLFGFDAPAAPAPSWGRAEAYAWLGQAELKLGRRDDALAAYRKALELEPNFLYVRHVLIPELDRKQER